jgi:hypothetical protein
MTIFSKFHANAQAELGLADRQQTPNAKVYPLKPSQNPYILHKAPRTWSLVDSFLLYATCPRQTSRKHAVAEAVALDYFSRTTSQPTMQLP